MIQSTLNFISSKNSNSSNGNDFPQSSSTILAPSSLSTNKSSFNSSRQNNLLKPNQPMQITEIRDKDKRCFQTNWYKAYIWIDYDDVNNIVFCFSCLKFGSGLVKNDTFVTCGFNNWKKAIEKFKTHEIAQQTHLIALCTSPAFLPQFSRV